MNNIYRKMMWTIAIVLMAFTSHTMAEQIKQGRMLGAAEVVMPDYFKDSFLDFREDAEEAGDEGKHMLLFIDLKGCPYCAQMIKDSFTTSEKDGGNKEFIQENFDSIQINLKGSREVTFDEDTEVTESELARALQVKFTPTILFMNAKNKIVARLDGYRSAREFKQVLNFVHEKAYETTDLPTYRQAHLKDDVYTLLDHEDFVEITDFQKANEAEKPLAVLFEDKTCDECDRFHKEFLDLPKTKALMKKFNFVRLDALSDKQIIDVDGNKTTAGKWLERKGISYRPTLMLFAEGEEVETVTGLLKSFHFQQLLSYIADKKYEVYSSWAAYGEEYSSKILKSGKNIDIWK